MITASSTAVGTLMAAAIASATTSAAQAAIHTARTLMAPVATGLSVRPAAASRHASQASLHHPIDSWPASMAGPVSTGPIPLGAACAATTVTRTAMARDGHG